MSVRRLSSVIVPTLAAVLLLAVAALASGVVSLPLVDDGDRPPCRTLPSRGDVSAALAASPRLRADVEAAGATVQVATPCPDGEDRALVRLEVGSDAARDRVHVVLRDGDGFGVPAQIVLR